LDKIDDLCDATKGQYPDPQENHAGELALRIGVAVPLLAAITSSVREYYSQRAVNERLSVLGEAVNIKANGIDAKVDAIKSNLESGRFAQSVALAIDETIRTTNSKKVMRLVQFSVIRLVPLTTHIRRRTQRGSLRPCLH
jgi:hypothetical protein